MPGLNQRGPLNEGPMTGGRRGICTSTDTSGKRFSGRGAAGRRPGTGRRLGKRGCQGYGWQMSFDEEFDRPPVQQAATEDSFVNRVALLESELAEIKNKLENLSKP